jgi:hypothetical protein
MTRNGKIARLPLEVRDELNRRLEDGETGKRLVVWLNGLAAVQELLREQFGGRPMKEQNLSEWKNGGYLEWQGQREKRGLLRQVTEEARELNEQTGGVEASREVVSALAAELALAMREGLQEIADPKERREWLLQVMAALAPLRREEPLQLPQELWDRAKAKNFGDPCG